MPEAKRTGAFTDLYEFTMAQSYLEHGRTGEAVFDLHVRDLPPRRGYLVAAGVQTLLDRLRRFGFDEETLAFLGEQGLCDELLDHLAGLSFEGQVQAVPEGRLVFPHEPIVQVKAPLVTGQLIETLVLNTVHVETLLATKAARCVDAVGGIQDPESAPKLVDFGARRAHGPDAARAAARSAYIAGFAGTSLVEVAAALDVPCFGTVAHAYIQSFPSEREAFTTFARTFPQGTTLLIDTYDTLEGAHTAVAVADELAREGVEIGAVRIDSGDLVEMGKQVRGILDEAGYESIDILGSGGLDEHRLSQLTAAGAPYDGYGVGTSMVTSSDHPSLGISYKLAAYEGEPVMKTSPGKRTLPGTKQVHRRTDPDGRLVGDTIALEDEVVKGAPLLEPATPLDPQEAVGQARARFLDEAARLPESVRDLTSPAVYPVARSDGLKSTIQEALARVGQG